MREEDGVGPRFQKHKEATAVSKSGSGKSNLHCRSSDLVSCGKWTGLEKTSALTQQWERTNRFRQHLGGGGERTGLPSSFLAL